MYKHELNRMLKSIPNELDIEISIVRTMGDTLTFFNYEKYKLQLFDDYLMFHDEDRTHKILYKNIVQINWRKVFSDKKVEEVIEAEFKEK